MSTQAAHHDACNRADDRYTEEYLQVQPGQQPEREETAIPGFPGGSDRCCKSIEEYAENGQFFREDRGGAPGIARTGRAVYSGVACSVPVYLLVPSGGRRSKVSIHPLGDDGGVEPHRTNGSIVSPPSGEITTSYRCVPVGVGTGTVGASPPGGVDPGCVAGRTMAGVRL